MKTTTIQSQSTLGDIEVSYFGDGSISIDQMFGGVSTRNRRDQRKLARALSPLYVVKSATGNYAGYGKVRNFLDWDSLDFAWKESQAEAVRFTSRREAKKVGAALPNAGARVLRLK